jgi:hypothetical protein
MTGQVFGISRLLADQHDPGSLRAFAENGLRRVAVEVAGGALSGGIAQVLDGRPGRNLDAGAGVFLTHRSCPVRLSS